MPTRPANTHSATSCRRLGVGEPGVVGPLDDVVGDLAAVDRDVAGEGVDSSVDGVARLGAGAHRVDVVLVDTEGAEHGGVERDAIGVVDSDADGDAGDLAVTGSNVGSDTVRRKASKADRRVGWPPWRRRGWARSRGRRRCRRGSAGTPPVRRLG